VIKDYTTPENEVIVLLKWIEFVQIRYIWAFAIWFKSVLTYLLII